MIDLTTVPHSRSHVWNRNRIIICAAAPLPNQWFNKRPDLARGICVAGTRAGGILFFICTNLIIENISLGGPFRITAISIFVNTIVNIIMRDRIKIISARYHWLELSLVRNLGFVAVIFWGFVLLFGYVSVFYSLSDFSVSAGLLHIKKVSSLECFPQGSDWMGQLSGRPYWSD